jgi:hypothetical protein
MKYIYTIYEQETDKYYYLEINNILKHIKNNKDFTYYKITNNSNINIINKFNENNYNKVLINKDIVLNTEFICHRINTISELNCIPEDLGVELDIRDDHKSGQLILSHDPFLSGDYFEDYLKEYKNNTMILNIKSERIELECLKLMNKYNIQNYFFLDSSFPMIYLLNKEYNNQNIACRFSEYEPIEQYLAIKDKVKYLWVDCFNIFPLTSELYKKIKNDNYFKNNIKICIVSPELQKQPQKIKEYRDYLINNNIIPEMICCKIYNIINWI